MDKGVAEELLDFVRDGVGEDLRAVAYYNREEYTPIYTSETVLNEVDETREIVRYPFMAINRAMWQISKHRLRVNDPEVVVHSYGTVQVVQFPISESDGVVFSCESRSDVVTPFIAACYEIVSGLRDQRVAEG